MKKKIFSSAIFIVLFAILSRLFGLFRELLISYYYGTSISADMFFLISSIPLVLYTGFALAYSNAFVSNYNKVRFKKELITSSMILISIISLSLLLLMLIFPIQLVHLFAPGIDIKIIEEYKFGIMIMSIQIFFIGFNGLFSGLLTANGRYLLPSIFNMLSTIFVVIAIYLFNDSSISFIFGAISFFYFTNFIIQVICIKWSLFKGVSLNSVFKSKINFVYIKKQLIDSLQIYSNTIVAQINYFIDRGLSSSLYIGALSTVNYAHKLNGFLIGIVGLVISNLIYPLISKTISEGGDINSGYRFIEKYFFYIVVGLIPISLLLSIFSNELISISFGNGKFSTEDLNNLSEAFSILIIGTGFYVLKEFYSYILYAYGKAKYVLFINIVAVSINILLNLLLIKEYEVNGLMISTIISYLVSSLLCIYLLKHIQKGLISYKRLFVVCFLITIGIFSNVLILCIF